MEHPSIERECRDGGTRSARHIDRAMTGPARNVARASAPNRTVTAREQASVAGRAEARRAFLRPRRGVNQQMESLSTGRAATAWRSSLHPWPRSVARSERVFASQFCWFPSRRSDAAVVMEHPSLEHVCRDGGTRGARRIDRAMTGPARNVVRASAPNRTVTAREQASVAGRAEARRAFLRPRRGVNQQMESLSTGRAATAWRSSLHP